jgi:SAM-dependent methyltransferase
MRNINGWAPSKFVFRGGRLRASKDRSMVGVGSRLVVDLVGECYDRHLTKHAGGRLLDLGCGNVPLYRSYRDHVSDVTCVDWPDTRHSNEFLDFESDLSAPLPLPDGEFDTIVLSDVLEHIPEPMSLWREMARILSPRGVVLINVPFLYWQHEIPHDYYRYTEYALRRFAAQTGFRIVLLENIGGALEVLSDVLAKNLQFVPLVGPFMAIALQSATLAFGRSGVGKRLSKATGQRFPLGYFLVAQKE